MVIGIHILVLYFALLHFRRPMHYVRVSFRVPQHGLFIRVALCTLSANQSALRAIFSHLLFNAVKLACCTHTPTQKTPTPIVRPTPQRPLLQLDTVYVRILYRYVRFFSPSL